MNNIDMMAWSASSMLNNKYGNTLIADCRKPLLVRVVATMRKEQYEQLSRTKFYVEFRGRFEASIISLSLLFVWDFHVCPSVCVEKDSKKPRPLKIIFFHQFLPKLETHQHQFFPRYMVVLNMERVVIKKPNRMKLAPLGESEPPNLQLFPPYQSQGLTTGKWNSLQEF